MTYRGNLSLVRSALFKSTMVERLALASLDLNILSYNAFFRSTNFSNFKYIKWGHAFPSNHYWGNLLKSYVPNISDKQLLLYTRISVVLVAFISCFLGFNDSNIHGLVVASVVLLMVCLFAPLTFGLFWKKASLLGAWTSIFAGGLVCFFSDYYETRVDPTIYGTISSCLGLVRGSFLRPDIGK